MRSTFTNIKAFLLWQYTASLQRHYRPSSSLKACTHRRNKRNSLSVNSIRQKHTCSLPHVAFFLSWLQTHTLKNETSLRVHRTYHVCSVFVSALRSITAVAASSTSITMFNDASIPSSHSSMLCQINAVATPRHTSPSSCKSSSTVTPTYYFA